MLTRPRRLPERFNRNVSRSTRTFVKHRHVRQRQYKREKWRRALQRGIRKIGDMRVFLWRSLFVLIMGLIALVIGIVLFSPLLTVQEIRVRRTDPRIGLERVQALLAPLFGRHILFLATGDVLPLLAEDAPSDGATPARSGIPDIVGVEVRKEYPSTLVLTLSLDPLLSRLEIVDANAAKNVPGTGSTLLDFLTAKGVYVAYTQTQVGSGTVLPVIRVVDWGVRPEPWKELLDTSFLRAMSHAEQAVTQQFGQKVRERTVYIRAREFHLRTEQYALWFDLRSPLEEQLLRYRLFLQNIGKNPVKEYIDLRLADRVVYK